MAEITIEMVDDGYRIYQGNKTYYCDNEIQVVAKIAELLTQGDG